MTKIIGFTTNKNVSSGAIAQFDFKRFNRIELVFFVKQSTIVLSSIASIDCEPKTYYLKPKTPKEILKNTEFYNKYILDFDRKDILDNIINENKN